MADILNPILNKNIKKLRKDCLKLTQQEFADKIGISRGIIAKIEIEEVNVTDRNVLDICKAFDVSEDWLRTGNEPIFIKLTANELYAKAVAIIAKETDPYKKSLYTKLSKLNEEGWELLKRLFSDKEKEQIYK